MSVTFLFMFGVGGAFLMLSACRPPALKQIVIVFKNLISLFSFFGLMLTGLLMAEIIQKLSKSRNK